MKEIISSFIAGGLFGAGLLISEMTNPTKVIGFLDLFGLWDPSLALVMVAALLVTFLGYRFVLQREAPFFGSDFHLPGRKDIDSPLIMGAALFGIGWGLSGLCPGPAMASMAFAGTNIAYFLLGMIGSIVLFRVLKRT